MIFVNFKVQETLKCSCFIGIRIRKYLQNNFAWLNLFHAVLIGQIVSTLLQGMDIPVQEFHPFVHPHAH